MIFKIRIAHWRFTFTFAPVTDIKGVNSTLPDGDHVHMWDFDDVDLELVVSALHYVQNLFKLPNIYILTTGSADHFIAYCFERASWIRSVQIVASTSLVDANFFKYGVYRGHWTLRVTPKEGRKPKCIKILSSPIPETASIDELNSWVQNTKDAPFPTLRTCIVHLSSLRLHLRHNSAKLDVFAYNMKHSPMLLLCGRLR